MGTGHLRQHAVCGPERLQRSLQRAAGPNGNSYADAEISVISHEASESITDWDGAWFDSAGFEGADECAYTYGGVAWVYGRGDGQLGDRDPL